jgi:monothiol glutaredoxin
MNSPSLTSPALVQIDQLVSSNPVVLFMKGNAAFPQCGFSATVAHVLERFGVAFVDVDVLKDPALRDGIKQYTNWPTIPQLYIKGEFIGGCDIVKEMVASGEFEQLLTEKGLR